MVVSPSASASALAYSDEQPESFTCNPEDPTFYEGAAAVPFERELRHPFSPGHVYPYAEHFAFFEHSGAFREAWPPPAISVAHRPTDRPPGPDRYHYDMDVFEFISEYPYPIGSYCLHLYREREPVSRSPSRRRRRPSWRACARWMRRSSGPVREGPVGQASPGAPLNFVEAELASVAVGKYKHGAIEKDALSHTDLGQRRRLRNGNHRELLNKGNDQMPRAEGSTATRGSAVNTPDCG